jgi:cytochrome P450 family 3 subfamily A
MMQDEVIGQGMVFLLAGYETTATTLQYLAFLLALNQDKQDKLHHEIVAALGDVRISSISYSLNFFSHHYCFVL